MRVPLRRDKQRGPSLTTWSSHLCLQKLPFLHPSYTCCLKAASFRPQEKPWSGEQMLSMSSLMPRAGFWGWRCQGQVWSSLPVLRKRPETGGSIARSLQLCPLPSAQGLHHRQSLTPSHEPMSCSSLPRLMFQFYSSFSLSCGLLEYPPRMGTSPGTRQHGWWSRGRDDSRTGSPRHQGAALGLSPWVQGAAPILWSKASAQWMQKSWAC